MLEQFVPIREACDPFANKTLNVYVSYEGGGAKGIVHIGALRAIERSSVGRDGGKRYEGYAGLPYYQVQGVNGTSIGAIVAALQAAGYTSNDLVMPYSYEGAPAHRKLSSFLFLGFRRQRQRSVVFENAEIWHMKEIFGLVGWAILRVARIGHNLLDNRPLSRRPILSHILTVLAIFFILRGVTWPMQPSRLDWLAGALGLESLLKNAFYYHLVSYFFLVWILFLIVRAGLRRFVGGFISTERLADCLDLALVRRIKHPELSEERKLDLVRMKKAGCYKRVVTFRMLEEATTKGGDRTKPLVIAATNLTNRELEVFSTNKTPDIIVAEAIAASAAFPFLFKPPKIENRSRGNTQFLYTDGGITSNLPVWVTDVPRRIFADTYSIAVAITARRQFDVSTDGASRVRRIVDYVQSGFFGARALELRKTRSVVVDMNPSVGLFDFDMSLSQARANIGVSENAFKWYMRARGVRRGAIDILCRQIAQAIRRFIRDDKMAALQDSVGDWGGVTKRDRPAIRVTFLRPARNGQNALATFWQFDSMRGSFDSVDDRIVYHGESSLPGRAWRASRLSFAGESWQSNEAVLEVVRKGGSLLPHKIVGVADHEREGGPRAHYRYTDRLLWNDAEWMLAYACAPPDRDVNEHSDVNPAREQEKQARKNPSSWVVLIACSLPLDWFRFSSETINDLSDPIAKVLHRNLAETSADLRRINDLLWQVLTQDINA